MWEMRQLYMTKEELIRYMKISQFPPVEQAMDDGLLCFGGELEPEILIDAYLHGIFPWPHEGYPLLWFFPKERGILCFDELHVSKSLQKLMRKNIYKFRINTVFEEVIENCARVPRKGQKGTWITPEIKKAYKELDKLGHILSVECFRQERLVGGLYGVYVAGVMSGESMFGLENNVSKLCIVETVKFLKQKGHQWMDIQMVTPVMESMGGKYISHQEYLKKLNEAHKLFFIR